MRRLFQIFRGLPLRRQFVIATIVLSLLPLLVFVLVVLWRVKHLTEAQVLEKLRLVAQVKDNAVEQYYRQVLQDAAALATHPAVIAYLGNKPDERSKEEAKQLLLQFQEAKWGMCHHVFLTDLKGIVRLSPPHGNASNAHEGQSIRELTYFTQALQEPLLTDFFGFEERDHYHQLALYPVRTADGQTVGLLVIELVIQHLLSWMNAEQSQLPEGARMFLSTLEGREIVHSKEDPEVWHRSGVLTAVQNQHGETFGIFQDENHPAYFGYYRRAQSGPFVLGLEVPAAAAFRKAKEQAWWTVGLSLLTMGFLVLCTYWGGKQLSRRIEQIAAVAQQLKEGNLTARVQEEDFNDEVAQIGHVLNQLASSIERTIQKLEQEKAQQAMRIREAVAHIEMQKIALEANVAYILEQMQDFAEGDLSVRLKNQTDSETYKSEFEQLFEGFNQAVANLEQMLQQVHQVTRVVRSHTEEIFQATDGLAYQVAQQEQQANDVAAAIEEMARTAESNAQSAKHTAEVAQLSKKTAQESEAALQQTMESIHRLAQAVQESVAYVRRLGQSGEQIGAIVSVIEEIATQTNLLALNAAIEAARAGDSGRGFAVVADEVRRLAERTAQATREIAEMIQRVQQETEEAVRMMEQGYVQLEEGLTQAEAMRTQFNVLLRNAEETMDMVTQIASASRQQAATSEEMAKNVVMITEAIRAISDGAQQIRMRFDILAHRMSELERLVSRFRLQEPQLYAN
jgi:methyl-accepting chemotaxis protein